MKWVHELKNNIMIFGVKKHPQNTYKLKLLRDINTKYIILYTIYALHTNFHGYLQNAII